MKQAKINAANGNRKDRRDYAKQQEEMKEEIKKQKVLNQKKLKEKQENEQQGKGKKIYSLKKFSEFKYLTVADNILFFFLLFFKRFERRRKSKLHTIRNQCFNFLQRETQFQLFTRTSFLLWFQSFKKTQTERT